jgi:hypothetical protein
LLFGVVTPEVFLFPLLLTTVALFEEFVALELVVSEHAADTATSATPEIKSANFRFIDYSPSSLDGASLYLLLALALPLPRLAFELFELLEESPPHPMAKSVSAMAVMSAASLFLFIPGLLSKLMFQKADGN